MNLLNFVVLTAVMSYLSSTVAEDSSSLVFVKEVSNDAPATDGDSFIEVEADRVDNELFIPSKVWQKVKPGQALPAGLHYRINLQTGDKEAKLLQDEVHSQKSSGEFVSLI